MPGYLEPHDVHSELDPQKVGGTASDLADTDLRLAIRKAQTEVDAALGSRYPVPFSAPVPELVRDITLDLAVWHATLTHRRHVDLDVRDPVQLRVDRARALLRDLAVGRATLPPAQGDTPAEPLGEVGAVNAPWHEGALFGGQSDPHVPTAGYGQHDLGWR